MRLGVSPPPSYPFVLCVCHHLTYVTPLGHLLPSCRFTRTLVLLLMLLPGTGAVYSFDPVGSYEREACRAAGAAQSLVQPFLDNQVSLPALSSSESPS
jgi:hypothetical protein